MIIYLDTDFAFSSNMIASGSSFDDKKVFKVGKTTISGQIVSYTDRKKKTYTIKDCKLHGIMTCEDVYRDGSREIGKSLDTEQLFFKGIMLWKKKYIRRYTNIVGELESYDENNKKHGHWFDRRTVQLYRFYEVYDHGVLTVKYEWSKGRRITYRFGVLPPECETICRSD